MALPASVISQGCRVVLFAGLLGFSAGCKPAPTLTVPPTPTAYLSPTPTFTPSPTQTETPSPSPTQKPLLLVFYGDSVLKVGEMNQPPSEGFSFVEPLQSGLPSTDQVFVSNHGGRRARWGYDNLQGNVLRLQPDLVTLWWGMNDLGGCPGVFNRTTNTIMPAQLSALVSEHVYYMRMQIDAMLEQDITVFVMTPIPVLGELPWSHFTPEGQLVWENDRHCDFNAALEHLVDAQRSLIADYSSAQQPVYLVDAWQVYKDNPKADKMYMDVVHPASHGAQLIADEWLRVFHSVETK